MDGLDLWGWYLFKGTSGLEGLLNSYSLGQMTKEASKFDG